MKKNPEKQP